MMRRRHFIAGAALPLMGCEPTAEIAGGFVDGSLERGHLLRRPAPSTSPSAVHRTHTIIVGAGVAGLAAARALRLQGRDDFCVLELEDQAGGNSRSSSVNGIACPLGAHYLPVPGDNAHELLGFLEELKLRQRVHGRWTYDERHLCHSPQERLFFNGAWQDGLLPLNGVGPDTLVQYQRFAKLVSESNRLAKWPLPSRRTAPQPQLEPLKQTTFAAYLNGAGLTDPNLLWYLNYCCFDDYGAGIDTVSAWAGIHYFASRHGFTAPRTDGQQASDGEERENILTWPEGNGWLTRHLALPLQERLHTSWVVTRIANGRNGVSVDAHHVASGRTERWQALQCIVALPVFVAARVIENPPDFLRQAAAQIRYAPWLVANLHLKASLQDQPGAAPSWDNVIHDQPSSVNGASLGYVDAQHQNLHSVPGQTVLTHYRALGDVAQGRQYLLSSSWAHWRDIVLADLTRAHPDIVSKTTRIDVTRYGHAMAIPAPQTLASTLARASGVLSQGSLRFAHSDWAGYSVFEEAFTLGHEAAQI